MWYSRGRIAKPIVRAFLADLERPAYLRRLKRGSNLGPDAGMADLHRLTGLRRHLPGTRLRLSLRWPTSTMNCARPRTRRRAVAVGNSPAEIKSLPPLDSTEIRTKYTRPRRPPAMSMAHCPEKVLQAAFPRII